MGPDDSLNTYRQEQWDFCGVANKGSYLQVGSAGVLEKTLKDGAANVTWRSQGRKG
jgi:hypothetical protein